MKIPTGPLSIYKHRALMLMLLPKGFYLRGADEVARDLLGHVLVRDINGTVMKGRIVETEAYFGESDPASRTFGGRVKGINRWMLEEGGTVFVYMVHGSWLLNVITGAQGEPSAVLLRALQPLEGVEEMTERRGKNKELTSGPGRLTQVFGITGELNGIRVYERGPLMVEEGHRSERVLSSGRIGVRYDIDRDMRFFLDGFSTG